MAAERVTFEVEGQTPLLMHNPAGMLRKSGGAKGPKQKVPTPEDEAEAGAYRLPDGALYLPATAFRAALLEAAKHQKVAKYSLPSLLAGAVLPDFETPECVLRDPESGEPIREYAVDLRRAVVQRNGVLRARPMIARWTCRVSFVIDVDFVPVQTVEETFARAGLVVGVGDFRPQHKGWFGRFTVRRGK